MAPWYTVAQTSSGASAHIYSGTRTGEHGHLEFRTSTLQGDCDGNGKITTNDAQMALQMAVLKLGQNMICDMNDDKSVNSIDVREILKLSQAGGLSQAVATVQKTLAEGQVSALPGTGGL